METYLNAGFGELLPVSDLELIRYLGFAGIRQNVPSPSVGVALVDNALDGGNKAIFIVPMADPTVCQEVAHVVAGQVAQRGLSDQAVIECGNEEDLKVADVITIAGQHGFTGPVVSGGISSVSHTALDWLKASRVTELSCGIGYHQYRSTEPSRPLDGYSSREDEFRALAHVAAGHDLWCTESGWTTAPHNTSAADIQVTENLREEIRLNEEHGAKSFCVYQLNDGPDPANDQDRFGIRRVDGSLKPQARVLKA